MKSNYKKRLIRANKIALKQLEDDNKYQLEMDYMYANMFFKIIEEIISKYNYHFNYIDSFSIDLDIGLLNNDDMKELIINNHHDGKFIAVLDMYDSSRIIGNKWFNLEGINNILSEVDIEVTIFENSINIQYNGNIISDTYASLENKVGQLVMKK